MADDPLSLPDRPLTPGEVLQRMEDVLNKLEQLPTPTLPGLPWRTLPHDPRTLTDEKIREQAFSLLQNGFRQLFRDVYDFGSRSYRPGMDKVGPVVFRAYKEFFDRYQLMSRQPVGAVDELWARQFEQDRTAYDKLKRAVELARKKIGTEDPAQAHPGELLFPLPGEGKTWRDSVAVQTEASRQRVGLGLLLLLGLGIYALGKRKGGGYA